jgi:hypothetical protein
MKNVARTMGLTVNGKLDERKYFDKSARYGTSECGSG